MTGADASGCAICENGLGTGPVAGLGEVMLVGFPGFALAISDV